MGIRISGVGGYVPAKTVTNQELAARIDTSHEWIVAKTGILERRLAGPRVGSDVVAVGHEGLVVAPREVGPDDERGEDRDDGDDRSTSGQAGRHPRRAAGEPDGALMTLVYPPATVPETESTRFASPPPIAPLTAETVLL